MSARRYYFCRIGGIVSIEKRIGSVARALFNSLKGSKNDALIYLLILERTGSVVGREAQSECATTWTY